MAILGNPQIDLLVGIVLVLIGLVLAFFGKLIWATMMGIIGAMIGWFLGYVIGLLLGGLIIALVMAFILMFVFSMIFGYLVELGLAMILGLMGFGVVYLTVGGMPGIVGGAIVLAIIFAIAYYFIEEVIAVATALIGGILAGAGVLLMTYDITLAIGVGIMIFVFGALVQVFFFKRRKIRKL